MKCAWQEYLRILPARLRDDVDRLGKDKLQELRLRIGLPPELIVAGKSVWLSGNATADDLSFIINTASQYSPWATATVRHGYITAAGGHRIGICGEAVRHNGQLTGIRSPSSLCIRVARDFLEIAKDAIRYEGSVLIIGKPGSGKTTLLRDLIRLRSDNCGGSVAVVDERGELFPVVQGRSCFRSGKRTDVLSGSSKADGIDMVLRTMGPSCIAVDEITAQDDCNALICAGWSGVTLLATAHAGSVEDLFNRPVYKPLIAAGLFDTVLVMQPDKSWKVERIDHVS